VIIAVLAFNFLGDGLRDAADPYGDTRNEDGLAMSGFSPSRRELAWAVMRWLLSNRCYRP
jgi:hypothetical protein